MLAGTGAARQGAAPTPAVGLGPLAWPGSRVPTMRTLHVGLRVSDFERSLAFYTAVGYPVVAAPTPERRSLSLSPASFLPQIPSLLDSCYALHEMIGLAWYVSHYGRW